MILTPYFVCVRQCTLGAPKRTRTESEERTNWWWGRNANVWQIGSDRQWWESKYRECIKQWWLWSWVIYKQVMLGECSMHTCTLTGQPRNIILSYYSMAQMYSVPRWPGCTLLLDGLDPRCALLLNMCVGVTCSSCRLGFQLKSVR